MTAQTLCSLKPMLLISDWEKAEKIMADYVERAALEPGLIYCGWTSDEDSTRAFLRVAHSSADAVLEHLDNVGPCLEALLGPDGGATLVTITGEGFMAFANVIEYVRCRWDGGIVDANSDEDSVSVEEEDDDREDSGAGAPAATGVGTCTTA